MARLHHGFVRLPQGLGKLPRGLVSSPHGYERPLNELFRLLHGFVRLPLGFVKLPHQFVRLPHRFARMLHGFWDYLADLWGCLVCLWEWLIHLRCCLVKIFPGVNFPKLGMTVLPNIKTDPKTEKTDLKQTQNWMKNRPLTDLLLLKTDPWQQKLKFQKMSKLYSLHRDKHDIH